MYSIKIKYTSIAVPQYPYNVKLNAIYECIKDKDKYFVVGKDFKREFSLNFIKDMFAPISGYNWNMLNPPKSKKKIINSDNIENKEQKIDIEE